MKLRLYTVLIISVVALALSAVFLRGTLPQQTALQVDGLDQFVSMEGVSPGPMIWNAGFNNITSWTLSGATVPAFLEVNRSLILRVAFPAKPNPQALSVYRGVNLLLDQDPIITITLRVSTGVSYGIRFFGVTANNISFAAWHEGSILQHRPGKGTQETISANLQVESYLANSKLSLTGARITEVLFYLEVPSLTSGTFTLSLSTHFRPILQ